MPTFGAPPGCTPGGAFACCIDASEVGQATTPPPSPPSPPPADSAKSAPPVGDTHSPSSPPVPTTAPTPPAAGPEIKFLLPRPVPFKMDFSPLPEEPSIVELAPVTFGEATQTRLRELLRTEMVKYPPGTLGALSAITVGSTLKYNGRPAGGFQFVGLVFIAAGEADTGAATDAHVVRAFHHEASHALMDAHGAAFDAARFRAALPERFKYRDELPGVVGAAVAKEAPPGPCEDSPSLDLLAEGFLVPWAKDSLHEDFSSYAEVLLRKPGLLLDLFAPDTRIGRKARVVRDFYVTLDPRFAQVFESARSAPVEHPPDR